MKKTLILVAIAITSLTACRREACYYCTTTQTFSDNTGLSPIVTGTSVCDMTKNDADNYEKENSSTSVTTTPFGDTVTTTRLTVCE